MGNNTEIRRMISRIRKSETTKKILELLEDGAVSMGALFIGIASSSYGSSMKRIQRNIDQAERDLRGEFDPEHLKRKRHSLHSLLSKLKRDGLIAKSKDGWIRTAFGKVKLLRLTSSSSGYKSEADNVLKIIMFDIREKERGKRDWLRARLTEMGFEMLQKSVWGGKIKIPKEFIDDLNNLGLFEYVDIFAVSKTGSLKKLNNNPNGD